MVGISTLVCLNPHLLAFFFPLRAHVAVSFIVLLLKHGITHSLSLIILGGFEKPKLLRKILKIWDVILDQPQDLTVQLRVWIPFPESLQRKCFSSALSSPICLRTHTNAILIPQPFSHTQIFKLPSFILCIFSGSSPPPHFFFYFFSLAIQLFSSPFSIFY